MPWFLGQCTLNKTISTLCFKKSPFSESRRELTLLENFFIKNYFNSFPLPRFRITNQTLAANGSWRASPLIFFFSFSGRQFLAARHYLTPVYGQWIMVQLANLQVPQLVARSQALYHKKWCHLRVLPPPSSPNPHPITNKSSEMQHPRGLPSKFSTVFCSSELHQLCANSTLYLWRLWDDLYWVL